MIMKHLEDAVEVVRGLGYVPVFASLYGSQNYGLDIYGDDYQSDYDVKVIVMPTLHDLVFNSRDVSRTVDYSGGKIDIKDAISMTQIICKMNPQYLETLLTPFYLVLPGGEFVEELRVLFPTLLRERGALLARASYGCFQEKIGRAQKITPSSEERIRKYGYDGKQIHHALRLKLMLEDFEKTGRVVLHPPTAYVPYLESLKKNEVPLPKIRNEIHIWLDEITACTKRIVDTMPVFDDSATQAVYVASQAMYLVAKSEASGIQSVREVKGEDR